MWPLAAYITWRAAGWRPMLYKKPGLIRNFVSVSVLQFSPRGFTPTHQNIFHINTILTRRRSGLKLGAFLMPGKIIGRIFLLFNLIFSEVIFRTLFHLLQNFSKICSNNLSFKNTCKTRNTITYPYL